MIVERRSPDLLVFRERNAAGRFAGVGVVLVGVYAILLYGALAAGIALAAGGLAVFLASPTIVIEVDRGAGRIRCVRRRMLRNRESSWATASVVRVEARQVWRMSLGGFYRTGSLPKAALATRCAVIFQDGSCLPLDYRGNSAGITPRRVAGAAGGGERVAPAPHLAEFLGVPFETVEPPAGGR